MEFASKASAIPINAAARSASVALDHFSKAATALSIMASTCEAEVSAISGPKASPVRGLKDWVVIVFHSSLRRVLLYATNEEFNKRQSK